MRSFLKYLLATVTGIILVMVIFFFISMGVVSSLTKSQRKIAEVKSNTILHLTLQNQIQDRSPNSPLENFDVQGFEIHAALGLNDILKCIDKAKADSNIRGIYLDLTVLNAGQATIEEIRNSLNEFKESGKFIVAAADYYTHKSYYLASVANEVYLTPTGSLIFQGLSANMMYFKKALEKLDVEPVIFRKGKYKSAVEPFMQEEISEANKEQWMALLNTWWGEKLLKISESRNLNIEELNDLAENLMIRSAADCKRYQLVDDLLYEDQVLGKLKNHVGVSEGEKLRTISLSAYKNVPGPKTGKGIARDKIAVIYAGGEIVTGKGDESAIGSERYASAIRKARKDDKIKAIVFRVNSPGGSALASEIILREVELAAQEKPVIVSMGDLAASGGYYISSKATKILAETNTITGSIGVFGALFNMEKLLDKKLGVTVSTVKTNQYADLGSPLRNMNRVERSAIQESIDTIYNTFLKHVAQGRNLEVDAVDSIAQGRVWSGKDALEIGLVDEIGGLNRAVEVAKEMTGLEHYRIVELPEQVDPFTELLKELSTSAKVKQQKAVFGPLYPYYSQIQNLIEQKGILARMPYNVEIY